MAMVADVLNGIKMLILSSKIKLDKKCFWFSIQIRIEQWSYETNAKVKLVLNVKSKENRLVMQRFMLNFVVFFLHFYFWS